MTETELRKRAKKEIIDQRGIPWFAPRTRYGQEKDIFGVWDCLALYPPITIVPIQITTIGNIRAREKKIKSFLRKANAQIYSEIWAYDKKKKRFRIFHLYSTGKAVEEKGIKKK